MHKFSGPTISLLPVNRGQRILASFGFDSIETIVRIAVLMLLVEALLFSGFLVQTLALTAAFLVGIPCTYLFRASYQVRPSPTASALDPTISLVPAGVEAI